MPTQPRYTLFRRLLFPYSGEDALSFKQSLRVLLSWMLLVPMAMSLCTVALTTTFAYSLQRVETYFLFTFLSGFFIFGSLGLLIVVTNNKLARIREARKAARSSNTSGDVYGS